jgi:outer membrane protein
MAKIACFALALLIECGSVSSAGAMAEPQPAPDGSGVVIALAEAARLLAARDLQAARQVVDRMAEAREGGTERDFLDGMISYSGKDYRRAEAMFRRILDRDPKVLRVRLELARTLYMERKDEQADYHFRLASAEHPSTPVMRNILRFREAMRARRSWRFSMDFGFAPDSNINSATDKETVDIYGLPFRLDPSARAKSGTGRFAGGDASLRLNRSGKVPIYLGAYARWTRYRDHRFDDAYVGAEAGPEFNLGEARLRTTATALMRWYGGRALVKSFGTHFDYDRLIGSKWTVGGALLVRHNDYAGRGDVDGWGVEARASANRPLGPTTLGFAYAAVERNRAKEIGWGLRPQLAIDVGRQVGDGPLAPFGIKRRDLLLQGSFSVYKRDWNLMGLAPSLSLTVTRNNSTVSLYHERRVRGELRLTRAF